MPPVTQGLAAALRRAEGLPPLSAPNAPADPSLLGSIGSGIGSGLHYVGTTLNKPSRALWSTLEGLTSGDWSGGGPLNLLPFSDTLGLTDPSQGVEASQFLENRGVLPENEPGFDLLDIPRFGLDVLGDPLTPVTGLGFGKALGRGGQALQKAGLLDDLTRASGKGPREYLSGTTLGDVLPTLKPAQRESLETSLGLGSPRRFTPNRFASDEETASVLLDPRKVDDLWRKTVGDEFYLPPEGSRRMRPESMEHWRNALQAGDEIESPFLDLTANTLFRDGRHRFAAIRELDEPFRATVPLSQAGEFSQRLGPSLGDDLLSPPLGGQLGLGLPFAQPSVTIGSEGVGRALDRLGGGLRNLPPVRLAAAAFDHRTRGRVSPAEQDWARGVTREMERASPQAIRATIKHSREWQGLFDEFSEHFGDDLFRQADDIDPRALEDAINDTLARKMSEWQMGAEDRAFRQKYFHLAQRAAGDVDADTIHPRFDEIVDEYRMSTGREDVTPDEVLDILRRSDPKPTRESVLPEARQRASEGMLKGTEGEVPWKQGDVVLAADRDNYGWVQKVGPRTSQVMFRNPETGVVAVKNLPNDQLTKAFDAGTEDAADMSRLATAKVFSDIMRHIGETGDPAEAFRFFAPHLSDNVPREFIDKMQGTMNELKSVKDLLWSNVEELGGKTEWLGMDRGHMIDHVMRNWHPAEQEKVLRREGKIAPHTFDSMRRRSPEIRELPAAIVTQLTKNKRYRGDNAAQNILADFEDRLDENWLLKQASEEDPTAFLEAMAPTREESLAAHAEALAAWVRNRPAMETRMVMEDAADYFRKGHTVEASLRASHDFLHEAAQKFTGETEGVLLGDVFNQSGMKTEKALEAFAKRFGMSTDQARRLKVDEHSARAVTGLSQMFDEKLGNTFLEPFLKHFDKWTRSFKTHVTVPWPAFFVRNFGSGQFVNASSGYIEGAGDLAQYGKAFKQAGELLKKARTGNISAAEQETLDAIQAYSVFQKQQGFADVEHFVPTGSRWIPDKVSDLRTHRLAAREFVEREPTLAAGIPGVNPLHRGIRTADQIGTAANQNVEWFNRVPMFLFLKGKGYSDEAAASVVEKLHFDYSRLSPAEREVFKRIAPFYTFTKKASELVFETLMDKPGGALAQTIRVTTAGQSDEPMPAYVAQTAAIPVGTLDDGTQRFLTGLGLAHEDPLSLIGGGVRDTLAELGSRTNPLIKGPLEWTFNESLFQRGPMGGRDLGDMDPTIGRTLQNLGLREPGPVGRATPFLSPGLEHMAVNTPFSRLLNTARTITDPRKYAATGGMFDAFPGQALGMQLLTGVRQTDISPQQRMRELREQMDALIRDEGGYVGRNVTFTKQQIKDAEASDPERAERMKQIMSAKRELQKLLRDSREDESPRVRLRRAG